MLVRSSRAPLLGSRRQLILEAARKASEVRRQLGPKIGVTTTSPICAADAAHQLDVDVRYTNDIKSMEGFYRREPRPLILVSSLRPAGRQHFTTAHELGHHVFGHEGHVLPNHGDEDEQSVAARFRPDEVLADAFAGHFLMPKIAVLSALKQRSLAPESLTDVDVYRLAWFFGVGYETIIRHLQSGLNLLPPNTAAALRKTSPKKVRAALLGCDIAEDLIPVDFTWDGRRSVDAQQGDIIHLPPGATVEGDGRSIAQVVASDRHRVLVKAARPGTVRLLAGDDWAVYLRIGKRQYVGLAHYRFLADEDEGEADDL